MDREAKRIYVKELRDKRRRRGLCINCGAPRYRQYVLCNKCKDRDDRRRICNPDKSRESVRKSLSIRREKLRELGICVDCGMEAANIGNVLGENCLKDRRIRARRRYKEMHAHA